VTVDFSRNAHVYDDRHGALLPQDAVRRLATAADLTKGTRILDVGAGDGARLPIRTAGFDAVVLSRLLYLVPDWRGLLRDVIRVLRPGGRILHEWANGHADEAWVQIREPTCG
jgi:ubiquinone/menaquinone biosynthesis C-methylase UbiE